MSIRDAFLLGLAVGLAAGAAVGYYAQVGTLLHAYQLLRSAQPPPQDLYLVAYGPGRAAVLTAMGTQLASRGLPLSGRLEYVGEWGDHVVLRSGDVLAVVRGDRVYSSLTVEGLVAAFVHGDRVYLAAGRRAAMLSLPDLREVRSWDLGEEATDAYLVPEDPPTFYVLTRQRLESFDGDLLKSGELPVGGDRVFAGALYLFVAAGRRIEALERATGRPVASAEAPGPVLGLRACRGLLFASTGSAVYVYTVPDLRPRGVLEVRGSRARADPTCTLVYFLANGTAWVVSVPSLHVEAVAMPFDDVAVKAGAAAAAAAPSGARQVALACG